MAPKQNIDQNPCIRTVGSTQSQSPKPNQESKQEHERKNKDCSDIFSYSLSNETPMNSCSKAASSDTSH